MEIRGKNELKEASHDTGGEKSYQLERGGKKKCWYNS